MDNFLKLLQTIYYLIWIPLGILLIAGIIFMIIANPFAKLGEFGPSSGGFSPSMNQGQQESPFGSGPNQGEFGSPQR